MKKINMLKVLFISFVSLMGFSSCAQKNNNVNTKKGTKISTNSTGITNIFLDNQGRQVAIEPCSKLEMAHHLFDFIRLS